MAAQTHGAADPDRRIWAAVPGNRGVQRDRGSDARRVDLLACVQIALPCACVGLGDAGPVVIFERHLLLAGFSDLLACRVAPGNERLLVRMDPFQRSFADAPVCAAWL